MGRDVWASGDHIKSVNKYMKVATDRLVQPYFHKTLPWIKVAVGFRSEFARINIVFVRFELHPILHLLENEIAGVDTMENAILWDEF